MPVPPASNSMRSGPVRVILDGGPRLARCSVRTVVPLKDTDDDDVHARPGSIWKSGTAVDAAQVPRGSACGLQAFQKKQPQRSDDTETPCVSEPRPRSVVYQVKRGTADGTMQVAWASPSSPLRTGLPREQPRHGCVRYHEPI